MKEWAGHGPSEGSRGEPPASPSWRLAQSWGPWACGHCPVSASSSRGLSPLCPSVCVSTVSPGQDLAVCTEDPPGPPWPLS